jgi:N-acetylglucosaminyldiphosphoundecaprenol N-acetyl-beta-D-mannosaminyltransferase
VGGVTTIRGFSSFDNAALFSSRSSLLIPLPLMRLSPTVQLFGIRIHRFSMDEAVRTLGRWMHGRAGIGPCRYVVTPNVDHVVKLQSSAELRAAYRDAAMVVADGWPLVTASRWLGDPLGMRVTGADLVPHLLSAGNSTPGFRVFLLGAAPGVAEVAARQIELQWPGVVVCGVDSPPLGFESDASACDAIVAKVNACLPHLLVVGFGAPKQEIWLHQHAAKLRVPVAIAAGATIDFLAGRQRRAPKVWRRYNLEWLYRALTNPRRLALRYAVDAAVFPQLFAKELWRTRKPRLFTWRADAAHP